LRIGVHKQNTLFSPRQCVGEVNGESGFAHTAFLIEKSYYHYWPQKLVNAELRFTGYHDLQKWSNTYFSIIVITERYRSADKLQIRFCGFTLLQKDGESEIRRCRMP